MLSIQSCNGEWLGESDDRFYIDGEATPSLVGTGMEDYFSDAWNLRLFSNLRAGVTICEPKTIDQRMTAYRWLFWHYGIWRVSLQGPGFDEVLDGAMDFFIDRHHNRFNQPENFLYGTWFDNKRGVHELAAGDYVMRFECIGANPQSRERGTIEAGYDMALDAISLRRLPWQGDMWQWLQGHLVREQARAEAMVAEAERVVAILAAAVEEFRQREGHLPARLGELLGADLASLPAGMRTRLPRDPWGQDYRYAAPGQVHTDGFDVWSVHGHSRRSSGWIGNW